MHTTTWGGLQLWGEHPIVIRIKKPRILDSEKNKANVRWASFCNGEHNECNFKCWAVGMLFGFGMLLLAINLFWVRVLFSHQRIAISECADQRN